MHNEFYNELKMIAKMGMSRRSNAVDKSKRKWVWRVGWKGWERLEESMGGRTGRFYGELFWRLRDEKGICAFLKVCRWNRWVLTSEMSSDVDFKSDELLT